ncbi:GILT-like protein 1 [Cephus cinctus]|uniref:GILT-like protein 1 n=1 Tax=Cephus cinctus TaxID=211228 RepID=A0AAJ7FJ23_CEPCN|nr:GILT-like protein 1 [Cephus cinctus]
MRFYLTTSISTLAIIAATLWSYGIPMVDAITPEFTRLKIDVYYESLCGDSVSFIRNQLVPSYALLKNVLNVTFVPYGKATHTKNSQTGKWEFVCQHGIHECNGNIAQACGLAEIGNLSLDFQQRQDLAVNFVGCVMSDRHPATAVPRCTEHVRLAEASRNRINQCKNNTEGDELLVAAGNKSNLVQSPLSFVPTIVLNENFDSDQQYNLLYNFEAFICGLIPEEGRPSGCNK